MSELYIYQNARCKNKKKKHVSYNGLIKLDSGLSKRVQNYSK